MYKGSLRTAGILCSLETFYGQADLCLHFVFSPFQTPPALNQEKEESCFTGCILYMLHKVSPYIEVSLPSYKHGVFAVI